MAKILIVDTYGYQLDWALRCLEAGHEVKWFIHSSQQRDYRAIGRGMVPKVMDWQSHMRWADLVVCSDNSKYVAMVDRYKDQGFPVFGACEGVVKWEMDRGVGQDIFEKAGIKTIPGEVFDNYDKAIAFVKKTMKRYVSKPSGDADKALSYCSKSPQDMVYMLERWKKLGKLKAPFILQEFVPGIEMAVGGWFGGGRFSDKVLENWEFKKLMNDDLSVATGEQGTVLHYTEESKLADEVLRPLAPFLAAHDYVGYVDVNCIITEEAPWPLEHTIRFGYPLWNIQQALHKGDPANWMIDLVHGKHTLKTTNDVACGVVMSQPPYPFPHGIQAEVMGIPIYGITPANKNDVHLAEAMLGAAPCEVNGKIVDKEMPVTAGTYILITSGTGKTVCEAKDAAYEVMDEIELPNSPGYRTDIGHRLEEQLPELHAMGYAEGVDYD